MKLEPKAKFLSEFQEEVYEGLTSFPKYLSSKYFYDKKGDKLFQQIMELPEYYLTGCEYSILSHYAEEITAFFTSKTGFDLIELGAGDGKKTKILLEQLMKEGHNFSYKPIDISENVLNELEKSVNEKWPDLDIEIQQGTYFKILEKIALYNLRKKVILVLGSNIGNLSHPEAINFLRNIQETMHHGDLLFLGVDQKKDPNTILKAYNDSSKVTEAFNKNLLYRINEDMEANFDPENFLHWPTYNPETGTTTSYLVSTIEQQVHINALNLSINFDKWESIQTEISQKYDDATITWLAEEAGLLMVTQFEDDKSYFKDYIFKKK
ncbi:MAG: L-histidine N(alpha)-methyltransferase [Leeuwenhoekiella sp.]